MNEFNLCGVRFRKIGIRNYWVSECGDVVNIKSNGEIY